MSYITRVSGNVLSYDMRIFDYDWDPIEDQVTDYLSKSGKVEDVWAAVHVSESTKVPVFEMGSGSVGQAFSGDQLIDYSWYVESLVRQKSPTLIYGGEYDAREGAVSMSPWMKWL